MTSEAGGTTVLLVNAIGDHLLALPTVRALVSLAPSPVVLALRRGARPWLGNDIRPDGMVELDVEWDNGTYRFDMAPGCTPVASTFVSLCTWLSPSVDAFARASGAARTVGAFACFGSTITLAGRHRMDALYATVSHTVVTSDTGPIEAWAGPPLLPEAARSRAHRLRAAVGERRLLVVHRETKPDKCWSDTRWAEVITWWADAHPDGIIVDIGRRPPPPATRRHLPPGWCHAPLALLDALALTATADLFIGVDSCFLHMADLAQVPGVGVFVTTDPATFGFRLSPHRHVVTPPDGPSSPVVAAIDALAIPDRRPALEGRASGS